MIVTLESNEGNNNVNYYPQLYRLQKSLLTGTVDTTEKDLSQG